MEVIIGKDRLMSYEKINLYTLIDINKFCKVIQSKYILWKRVSYDMQYGMDIPVYKRVDNKKGIRKKTQLKSNPSKILLMTFIGLMLSRVQFGIGDDLIIAPFGIAYLLSIVSRKDDKYYWVESIGIFLGYLSLYTNKDVVIYMILSAVILSYKFIFAKLQRGIKVKSIFIGLIIIFVALGVLFGDKTLEFKIIGSSIKAISIVPIFYVINYGLDCIDEINSNYFFSTEELISISILLCLVIAGVGDFSIFGVQIRNIIALVSIITIAYSGGTDIGAVLGITMGLIIGIANNDILISTTLYGACGLIVGVFKEVGKIISVLAYLVACFMVMMYSGNVDIQSIIEIGLAAVLMICIPTKLISGLLMEINNDEKRKALGDIQIEGVKSEFMDRLENLKSVFSTMSISLNNLSENDKLHLKGKGTALVGTLADRVCASCEMNKKCWERELHSTFSDFGQLMLSWEAKKPYIPQELSSKCVKKNTLLKTSEELFNTYTVNEALKTRLAEGRNLIANQINNMSLSIGDALRDFEKDVSSCLEIDKIIRKTLSKNRIKYKGIYSYTDRDGKLKIKVRLDNCDGSSYCVKNILPIISGVMSVPLCLSDDGCKINPDTNECLITVEETPKYHVASYVAFAPKEGEKCSGDSFSFGKNKNGKYITSISDGMGSGPEAGLESGITIDLVEKFIESGFGEATALNVVNSIMAMKFNEDEKFTTLDMNSIDLYTGDISFLKVGGVVSFVKSGKNVEVIDDSSLPFGILESIDIKAVKRKLKHGDIIVTISDGILDVDKNNLGNYSWLSDFLKRSLGNPEVLSREILDMAKSISGQKVLDDMTVVVSKLYSVY